MLTDFKFVGMELIPYHGLGAVYVCGATMITKVGNVWFFYGSTHLRGNRWSAGYGIMGPSCWLDICVENRKLFTSKEEEESVYTTKDLMN